MKKTILIVSIALSFVACKQKSEQTDLNNYSVDSLMYNHYPSDGYNSLPTAQYPTTHRISTQLVYHHKASYVSRSSYQSRSTVVSKKGWSRAAKGAAIGAGSGAILGAVLSHDHHRVKGAVIGGAVGAAGGYLYGRHRDKKYGRY